MLQYEWVAPKTNNIARTVVAVLLLGALALMLISTVFSDFRWIPQLISLGFLTAGIFLTTRYLTKIFIYRIVGEGEALDLTVSEAGSQGKRQTIVCRVGLHGIQRVSILSSADAEKQERTQLKQNKIPQFDYRPDLRPAKSLLVIVEEGGEELALFLAYEERLASYLHVKDEGQ